MELWRQKQRESFTSLEKLIDFLELDLEKRSRLISPPFPLLLPRRLAEKIPKNCIDSPMARQFLPLKEEWDEDPQFSINPLQEVSAAENLRLMHKYQGRVLILASSACAMHCRYCFRKEHPLYSCGDSSFVNEVEYIRNDPSIHEVILSGGDPLSLSDRSLDSLLTQLSSIEHVQVIRFHTRFLLGIPERTTKEFLGILQRCTKQCVFILHVNHKDELDEDIIASFKQISQLGIPLLTQSVLLRGINDNLQALKELSLSLIQIGVIPYYLHQFDPVEGGKHFYVPPEVGVSLISDLRNELPGYAVPTFVQEIPNQPSKTPLPLQTPQYTPCETAPTQ